MENQIEILHLLEQLKKQPFSTPPYYFDKLTERIQEKVYHQHQFHFHISSIFSKTKYILALASITIILLSGILVWNLSTHNIDGMIENKAIVEYFQSSEIETDLIIANYAKSDFNTVLDAKNQEIINYLVESDVSLLDLADIIN